VSPARVAMYGEYAPICADMSRFGHSGIGVPESKWPGTGVKLARIVGLPEAWKTFDDGTPQPNWVALLYEARCRRR
jgi:hypothetical protein